MIHGSLFSGIGGFDLAAEWMGWENAFHCELNPFGQKVLKYYWPNATQYNDITQADFSIWNGKLDLLSGGFPCQPFSVAGKREGKADERHLWPEMLRCIRECKPRWIVGENVPGLISWNEGVVFNEVWSDLESEGYEVQPVVLGACAKNAPHRRQRVWIVAHSSKCNDGRNTGENESESKEKWVQKRNEIRESIESGEIFKSTPSPKSERGSGLSERTESTHTEHGSLSGNGDAADTERLRSSRKEHREKESGQYPETDQGCGWQDFPTQSPICDGDDGFSSDLDGITFPKWRNESIKAGGNAIVPQIAYEIFQVIQQMDK